MLLVIPEQKEEIHQEFAVLAEKQPGVEETYTGQNLGQQRAADWMEDWFGVTGFRGSVQIGIEE